MGTPRIRDIPSLKKMLDDVHSLEQLKRVFPLLKPFLRVLGVQVDEMEAALAQLDPLADSMEELARLPDRFNELFAARGWIMYDAMKVEVAQAAITKAEANDIDGAEQDLVEYYNEQTVRWNLMRMNAVKAFRPRMRLAQLALTDYVEGHYHACVPVTLALLDGMVNELGQHGFFAKGVNLEAWDSIAAHSSGLAELAKLLGERRKKTTTEPITIPYRHGVLHGMDLGYDNKRDAAKAWAALFVTRDWALKAEQGQLTEPSAQPKPTWRDILRQIRENADDKARLQAWVPRTIQPGGDIPASDGPEKYEDETPEQRLVELLTCWRARNYGHMARCIRYSPYRQERGLNKVAGQLRAHYEAKRLKTFTMLELRDEAPAVTVIKAKVVYEEDGSDQECIVDFRLVYEDSAGRPIVRGNPSGTWKILRYLV